MRFRRGDIPVATLGIYQFIPQNGVSLAWIPDYDVERLKKKKCCGDTRQQFFVASEAEVERWQCGSA